MRLLSLSASLCRRCAIVRAFEISYHHNAGTQRMLSGGNRARNLSARTDVSSGSAQANATEQSSTPSIRSGDPLRPIYGLSPFRECACESRETPPTLCLGPLLRFRLPEEPN